MPSADSPPSRWLGLFAIDLRSLAVFRIALGALILIGLACRTVDFRVFFTDEGVWPVAFAWADGYAPGVWSLHLIDGSFQWQATLWLAEAFAGLALLLGWRTRVAAVLAWVLVASAQRRNLLIVSGAGSLLRQLLFWGMWLPLSARWSLDARKRQKAEGGRMKKRVTETEGELSQSDPSLQPSSILSFASAALLLQVALVYWCNALHKTDPAWRTTGEAVWMTLSQEAYTRPLGRALLEWPGLLRVLTHATFALEALGPFITFIPWANARWRLLTVALFMFFHAGLAATLSIGMFPFVSMASWLPFLPGVIWSRRVPSSTAPIRASRPVNVAAAVCFLFVIGWNGRKLWPWLLPILNPVCHALRLEQHWAMFAPRPRQADSWFVPVGTDAAGKETNLWTGESPVKWRRPPDFARIYPTGAWKQYLHRMRSANPASRRIFVEWLARRWQAAHPGAPPFTKLELYELEESIYRRGDVPDNFLLYDSTAR